MQGLEASRPLRTPSQLLFEHGDSNETKDALVCRHRNVRTPHPSRQIARC
jgi:hypothetical protein